MGDLVEPVIGKGMFDIERGDQGLHLWPDSDVSFDGQWETIALCARTDLDHLSVLGGQRSDGRDIDLLGDLTNGSFSPRERSTTRPTVRGLHHHEAVWVR